MDKTFVGRASELKLLHDIYNSGRPEFIAVYGRRRVGKTYLIQQFFNNDFSFSATGVIDGQSEEELFSFTASLIKAGYNGPSPSTWMEAFEMLKATLESQAKSARQIIYIDELPCFDYPKSGFVRALGYFWNTWASLRNNVILIVCGSSTSWMIDNIIDNHGGLHDRITHSIYLSQFSLSETEAYLQAIGIHWPRQLVAETYMMLGGIPYYLSLLHKGEGLAQNIDRLYFKSGSELNGEYKRLYSSLFRMPETYLRIVELLSKHKIGMTRKEILEGLHLSSSGTLSQQLDNLVKCDIIRRYVTKMNGRVKTKEAYYQLKDLFTLFHLHFSQKLTTADYWQQHLNSPVTNVWRGLAFEQVCLSHPAQIRHALGLDRIAIEYYSWKSRQNTGAQIDLIIERADRLINLCEIKYCDNPYIIKKEEDMRMRNRIAVFRSATKTKCGILPTWITPFGLHDNKYTTEIQYQVTLEDLFYPSPL